MICDTNSVVKQAISEYMVCQILCVCDFSENSVSYCMKTSLFPHGKKIGRQKYLCIHYIAIIQVYIYFR
jgi:hypothetical protein